MQTKRRIIAGKIEAVEGTAEVLTNAEAGILVTEPSYTPEIAMLPRNVIMATFSKMPDLSGKRMARIAFKAEVIGRGVAYAAGTKPRLSPFLRACGLDETVDATPGTEKVTYKRASADIPSLTIAFLDDDGEGGAVIKLIAGARGNVKFSGSTATQLYAEFSFVGVYVDVEDGDQLVATYDAVVPPQILEAQFALGAFAPSLDTFEIDLGNKLAGIADLNTESGYRAFQITDGDTRGRMDPEMVPVATYDYYGKLKAGTLTALSIGAFGPAQYNKLKLTAPKQRITNVQEAEREGLMIVNADFQLAMNAGDDEFVLEFS